MYVFWEIGHLKNNEGIEWPTKSSRSFEVSQSGTKSIWKKVPSREAALFASAFLKYLQGGAELLLPFHVLFWGLNHTIFKSCTFIHQNSFKIEFNNLKICLYGLSNTYLSFISLFLLIFSLLSMRPTYMNLLLKKIKVCGS